MDFDAEPPSCPGDAARSAVARIMEGHGLRITSLPPVLGGTSLPSLSTMAASIPKNGRVAVPGLVGVAPGMGLMRIAPVSVCHHVSTIGQRPPSMTV